MKKTLTFLSLVVLLFSSCSSDDSPLLAPEVINPTLQEVTFKIKGFDVGYEEMTLVRSVDLPKIEELYYYVFSQSDNKLVKRKHLSGENVLDELQDTLPLGKYYISILASESLPKTGDPFYKDEYYDTFMDSGYDEAFIISPFGVNSFYKTFSFTVGVEPVVKSLILNRVNGRCDIIIEDAALIPEEIESITFEIKGLGGQMFYLKKMIKESVTFHPNGATAFRVLTVSREQILASSLKNPLSFYALGYTAFGAKETDGLPIYMFVKYKDGQGVNGDDARIRYLTHNLKIYRNKITRLSGKLFDTETSSYNLMTEYAWLGDISEQVFVK